MVTYELLLLAKNCSIFFVLSIVFFKIIMNFMIDNKLKWKGIFLYETKFYSNIFL